MKERKITGTLGGIIIIALLILVYTGKATLAEASGFITIALALFSSKDELFLKNFTGKKGEKPKDDKSDEVQ